jgi:large subunit ribosomal protein L30
MAKLKITQVRSTISRLPKHRRTIKALGLGRIRKTVIHEDTPQIRGMIRSVAHLVRVEQTD